MLICACSSLKLLGVQQSIAGVALLTYPGREGHSRSSRTMHVLDLGTRNSALHMSREDGKRIVITYTTGLRRGQGVRIYEWS